MATKGDPLRLGAFVMAGTLVLVAGLYLLGSKRNLFSRTITVHAHFQNVGGLRPGNNVRYMGINVGTVEQIALDGDTAVRVTLAIRTDAVEHIRSNAVATVGTDGLMGNRLVNLAPGDGQGGELVDGTVLPSSVPLDTDLMLRTLDRTNANLASITDEVRKLAVKMNKPGNALDLLTDTLLAYDLSVALIQLREAATHARSATEGVDELLGDVRTGKGALGTLVADPASEAQVRRMLGNLAQISDSLRTAAQEVDRFTRSLNSPTGTAGTLVADTAFATDMRRTITRLDTSTVLLNENLRALQRNWFFRGYFKDQEKERKKQEKKASP
ncbi:MAG: MCE family protein [Flavobacteriales bacterium]|nr:MCE family protein [Flavobacteriales bacterium]